MSSQVKVRTGGHLVVECLEALGAEVIFGLPGIHALPMWEGLRNSRLRSLNFRTELNAGFAADGYARVSGRPAPLLLSTGPGALNSLTALMEAAASYVPVVAISSQIPRDIMGKHRGFLHELDDQIASFAPVVKWAATVDGADRLPELLTEAWQRALTPPTGPTFVEVPFDLLQATVDVPRVTDLKVELSRSSPPEADRIAEAAAVLASAARPVIWAGGGVLRSGAWGELRRLAERLDAPVATTYMGKGAIPEDHPLSLGSSPDDRAFQELLTDADVVLAVGTELGAETTAQYTLKFNGRLIQVDVDPRKIGSTYSALGLVGDAKATLRALIDSLTPSLETSQSLASHERAAREGRRPGGSGGPAGPPAGGRESAAKSGRERVAAVRNRIERGLNQQGRTLEQGMLETIRHVLARDAVSSWDMTILGYWAAAQFPVFMPRRFLYPLGSGTLGYAWPAALGAKAALPKTPVLAVVGDGGFLYGTAELLTARQHRLDAKLLLIDDGGYGILREYQRNSFGETHAVDLIQPDFMALCAACGVPARLTNEDRLEADLRWAMASDGPAVVIFRGLLKAARPTN